MIEYDERSGTRRTKRCEQEKRAEIRRMTSFVSCMSKTENLVSNYLTYCESVKRFENRNDLLKFYSASDGTGIIIE